MKNSLPIKNSVNLLLILCLSLFTDSTSLIANNTLPCDDFEFGNKVPRVRAAVSAGGDQNPVVATTYQYWGDCYEEGKYFLLDVYNSYGISINVTVEVSISSNGTTQVIHNSNLGIISSSATTVTSIQLPATLPTNGMLLFNFYDVDSGNLINLNGNSIFFKTCPRSTITPNLSLGF